MKILSLTSNILKLGITKNYKGETMKRLILSVFLVLFSLLLFSQTQVSGNQSGKWSADASPFQVVGDIVITSGNSLTIEPGVTVKFMGHYQFIVHGQLQAMGTETDSIYFTTDNHNVGWGGIRIDSSNNVSHLSYCRIEWGKTSGDSPNNHGGAIALLTADAVVTNCVIAHNQADTGDDGMGGAVYGINTGSQTRFENCKFMYNHAYGEGGAIKYSGDINSKIINCEFIGNNCNYGGGAISLYSVTQTKITKCLFANNYTEYSSGGAIHTLGIGNSFTLENCTITQNSANHGDGGAISLAYADANIVNTIIYDNPGMYSDGIYMDYTSTAQINYSNLQMPDNATGTHNMNQNPLFVDADNGDFHLAENSPCIDAGTDIGLDYYGEAPDMGCFEWQASGFDNNTVAPNNFDIKIFPNPFVMNKHAKSSVKIDFNLSSSESIAVEIYNLKGELIKEFDKKYYSKGNHTILWNVSGNKNLSAGVYLISLKAENKSFETKKIVLIK